MPNAALLAGSGIPPLPASQLGSAFTTRVGVGTSQTSGPTLGRNTFNTLTTAGGATACTLPVGAPGDEVFVAVTTSTTGLVFPPVGGGQINGGTANTGSVNVAQNATRWFVCRSPLQWASFVSG